MHPTATSTSSSHSSGSLSSGSGSGYGDPYGNQSTKRSGVIGGGRGSTLNLHLNPSEYSIPGVTPGSHISYAVAGARVYHNTQQITQSKSHHGGTTALSFGRNRAGGGGGLKKDDDKKKGQWVYSCLKGTLVFGRDVRGCGLYEERMSIERITAAVTSSGREEEEGPRGDYWFQLVDDETGKVVWRFKVPMDGDRKFSYEFDRPFFHVFQGSSRKYGFLFDDDREANGFFDEVNSRVVGVVEAPVSPPKASIKSLPRNFRIRSNKKSKTLPPSPSPSPLLPPTTNPSSMVSSAANTTTTSFGRLTRFRFNQTNEGSRFVEI